MSKIIDFSKYHPLTQKILLETDLKIVFARNYFLQLGRCCGKCYVDKELRRLRGQMLTQIMIDEFKLKGGNNNA